MIVYDDLSAPWARTGLKSSVLDLAHSWGSTANATAAAGRAAHAQAGHDSRGDEGSETEPEEGGGSLGFATCAALVAGAGDDSVGGDVSLRKKSVHARAKTRLTR